MVEAERRIAIHIFDDMINSSMTVIRDPRGASNAIMHYSQIWKNGKFYTVEVLLHSKTNRIIKKKFLNNTYEKTDKRRLYQLIDMYLSGKISESTFCHEFYCSYDLEIDYDTLMKDEYKAFYELSEITSRFSEFEKDIKNYPGVYYTKEEVKQKTVETKEKLKKYFEEIINSNDDMN